MRIGLVLAALVVIVSCSGGGESSSQSTTGTSPVLGEADASVAPPVTQLSPQAQEELGSLEQPATGGQSTGPLGSTVLDLDTDEGSVQIGEGEVPESMSGLPQPDGLRVELASSTTEAAGFSAVATQSVGELADFYRQQLVDAGYRIVGDEAPTSKVVLLRFEGDDGSGDVALSDAPGAAGTTVIVTFSPAG